jgi:hypothetical protein
MPKKIKALGKKISYKITVEDFIAGFRKWKECTLTLPSGCHLGHYKAIVANIKKKKKPEEE